MSNYEPARPAPAVNVAAQAEANGELPEQQPGYVAPAEDTRELDVNVARRAELGQVPADDQVDDADQGERQPDATILPVPDGAAEQPAGEGVLTVEVQQQTIDVQAQPQ